MKWYSMNLNKCNKCMEEDTAKVYLADDVDKRIEEIRQALKEASGMVNTLISYAEYEKHTQEMCKNHAESRDIQDLIELANDTVKQAEQLLKGGE